MSKAWLGHGSKFLCIRDKFDGLSIEERKFFLMHTHKLISLAKKKILKLCYVIIFFLRPFLATKCDMHVELFKTLTYWMQNCMLLTNYFLGADGRESEEHDLEWCGHCQEHTWNGWWSHSKPNCVLHGSSGSFCFFVFNEFCLKFYVDFFLSHVIIRQNQ